MFVSCVRRCAHLCVCVGVSWVLQQAASHKFLTLLTYFASRLPTAGVDRTHQIKCQPFQSLLHDYHILLQSLGFFFYNRDLFCFDIKEAYRIFPLLGFLWGGGPILLLRYGSWVSNGELCFWAQCVAVLHKVKAASLYFTGLYGASHLRTSHKRLL